MPRDVRLYLFDILTEIAFVESVITNQDATSYERNDLLRRAIERSLTIIGEAVVQIQAIAPEADHGLPKTTELRRFRNVLVHGYFALDHARVFDLMLTELPPLKQAAQDRLESLGQ